MRRASAYATILSILSGLLFGCGPSSGARVSAPATEAEDTSVQRVLVQMKPADASGQQPNQQAGEIQVSDGRISGRDQLKPTNLGFKKWEWSFRAGKEAYEFYRAYFVALIAEEPISVLEYWTSHSERDPDINRTEWREEYAKQGQRVQLTTYSDEIGYRYERYTYDKDGRLIKVEQRSSVKDRGFDGAEKVWKEYSYTIEYFVRTDGEAGVYRIATDFSGKPYRIDREREIDSGWEYMYDPDLGKPTILRLELLNSRLLSLTETSRIGKKIFSYEYDTDHRISKTVETKSDGASPLFTTTYEYDAQGRLASASTWDHRTNKQGQIRTFGDQDERGNWSRVETRTDGKVNSIIVRHLKYR